MIDQEILAKTERRIGDIIYLIDNSSPVNEDWEFFAKERGRIIKGLAEEVRSGLRIIGKTT